MLISKRFIIFSGVLLLFAGITRMPTQTIAAHAADTDQVDDTPCEQEKWCIVGGYENIGYIFARHLSEQGIPCTLLVPSKQFAAAQKLFRSSPTTKLMIGDASKGPERLKRAAHGASYIFIDMEFPYRRWGERKIALVTHAISAAAHTGATLIYPGRIYPYGITEKPITEECPHNPNSHQGRIMSIVESKLREAGETKRCKSKIVRISYPFGPGMNDVLMSNTFTDMPKTGELTWLYSADNPAQFVYSEDIVRFTRHMLDREHPSNDHPSRNQYFESFNCPSFHFDSVNIFGKILSSYVQKKYTPLIISGSKLKLFSFFKYDVKRGIDVAYAFKRGILLDETKQKTLFPDFTLTPLNKAIKQTIDWYKIHG